MNPTIANKIKEYTDRSISRIKLGITDIDGVMRGKYISLKKFESLFESVGGFCDCIFGWDVNDELYSNEVTFTGWHTAFPDAQYKLIVDSERWIADEHTPFFIAELIPPSGQEHHPICPRNILQRVLRKGHSLGLDFSIAFEYEFFVFDETPHSIREKNYRDLRPLTPGMFGYSVLRNSTESELFTEFLDYCTLIGVPLEGLHCETGPGVWEAAIEYDSALAAVDKAALFKTFSKVFFQKRSLLATFMARWSLDFPGQSGHIHLSAVNANSGESAFYDAQGRGNMSPIMEHFVAGMLHYMRAFLPMTTPTINSYTRLVKGFWAPTAATWGVENRTCALRVIEGSAKSQRVEYRVGSADANPYLAAAAVIAAGLRGIEESLSLPDPITGNAYEIQETLAADRQLPSTLKEATAGFKQSAAAQQAFGEAFVDHFAKTREWEVAEYEKAITDWQLQRYFEII